MKHIYVALASLLFAALLFGSAGVKIADSAGWIENKDLGNAVGEMRVYEGTPADALLNGFEKFKYSVSDIFTNCIPWYYETVSAYGKLTDTLDKPLMSLYSESRTFKGEPFSSDDPDFTGPPIPDRDRVTSASSILIGASREHRNYRVDLTFEDGASVSFLDTAVTLDDETKTARVISQAEKLNNIAAANDFVNFYFMLITRLQDTEGYENIIQSEQSTKAYADEFLGLLSDDITADRWDLGSARDRSERVFLTDHHWNANGSYLGFLQLCRLMCPGFTPVERGGLITFPDSKFYGSFARIANYGELWDGFAVNDYPLGESICDPHWEFDKQVSYLSRQKYDTPDKNIYAIFFPEIYKVEYPENNTGRNLLVLGDSYTQGIANLLGSAFDTTVIYYYTTYGGLDYNAVIEKYGITDVLFMQFSDRILFDLYNDCKLDSIKLK